MPNPQRPRKRKFRATGPRAKFAKYLKSSNSAPFVLFPENKIAGSSIHALVTRLAGFPYGGIPTSAIS
jgi:hypothetical protein